MQNIKNFLANLAHKSGVYQMLDEKGVVIYVGKAKDLKNRVTSYFTGRKDPKTALLVEHIKDIDFTVTHTENEAVLLECNLIKKYHPRFNILLRDDKSYPYILITNQHDFPRIDIYHGKRKKIGLFFGPYPSAFAVRETISLLQKIFRIRTCRDSYFDTRSRPCLLYQIGRCTGPCVNLISQEDYAKQIQLAILFLEGKNDIVIESLQTNMQEAADKKNYEMAAHYRDQITRLRQIQDKQYMNVGGDGNADIIGFAMQSGIACIQLLSIRGGQVLGSRSYFPKIPVYTHTDEILSAFLTQHYLTDATHLECMPKLIVMNELINECLLLANVLSEQAKHKVEIIKPSRGDKKKWLEMATHSAEQALAAHIFNKTNLQERAQALAQVVELSHPIKRIECFDISHSMGEATVGSCVVFDQTGPIKSDYRRYNITDITPGDDVAAMHQLVLRRFKHNQIPDIILIDGGTTQLSAAKQALAALEKKEILLIGVSKGPDKKPGFETLHRLELPPMHLPPDSIALHFIQQIRDEAHRFAITGHRNRRDKIRRQSSLEQIAGIGAKRRRELLRYFGGIQGIAHASLDELTKVPGISRSLAERIFAALHDATV